MAGAKRRLEFGKQILTEDLQIERFGFEFQFASFGPANDQDVIQ